MDEEERFSDASRQTESARWRARDGQRKSWRARQDRRGSWHLGEHFLDEPAAKEKDSEGEESNVDVSSTFDQFLLAISSFLVAMKRRRCR